MRRGINHKRINITVDGTTMAILEKYRKWGTPVSALIRKAVLEYEGKSGGQNGQNGQNWEGVDVTYD